LNLTYPPEAKKKGYEGFVILSVEILSTVEPGKWKSKSPLVMIY